MDSKGACSVCGAIQALDQHGVVRRHLAGGTFCIGSYSPARKSEGASVVGMCPCGCGPRADLHERGFTVADLPDEEKLAGLDELDRLLTLGEHDARLLDGRDFDPTKWDEGHRLIGLLRERAS